MIEIDANGISEDIAREVPFGNVYRIYIKTNIYLIDMGEFYYFIFIIIKTVLKDKPYSLLVNFSPKKRPTALT